MTIEQAFARTYRAAVDPARLPKRDRLVTAWGETKSAGEWETDPRAKVSARLIADRIRAGCSPEDAISLTPQQRSAAASMDRPSTRFQEAFGERKSMRAWARDPRCPVSHQGLFYRVLVAGMTVEEAFALGGHDPERRRRPSSRYKKLGRKPRWSTITAWGETRTLEEWAADPRARASARLIRVRIDAGYPPEAAISAPRWHREGSPRRVTSSDSTTPVTAWGETQTLAEWAADPRASVSAPLILGRIARGYTPEQAISNRRWKRTNEPAGSKPPTDVPRSHGQG